MSRYQPTSYENLSEDRQALFQSIASSRSLRPGQTLGGPFDPWLESAEMARRLVGLGDFFRFRTCVDRRYIELVILVTGQFWQAQFEWFAHEPMARKAGVSESTINAIKTGSEPEFEDQGEAIAYAIAQEIHQQHELSESTYHKACQYFGQQGLSELLGLCGFYTSVSMTLNAFKVPLPEGAQYPFEQR
jgi:4-carboxymuconolactone decarboxylase